MADILVNTPGYYSMATNDRLIYMGGNGETAELFSVSIEAVDSWDGAATVQRRVHEDHPTRTPGTFDEAPYQKLNEGGAVSDAAYYSDVISGTGGNSQILVDATGADIALNFADRSTGSAIVRVKKRRG